MMKIKSILFFLFLLISQWTIGQMSNYKSLYIYNFIKRIEWPASLNQEKFVIIVMGDKETYGALKQISENKKIGEQEIKVLDAESITDIVNINLIYVGYSDRKHISNIADLIGDLPILLVSDYKNSEAADINFKENDEGLEFIIRPTKIKKKGMKISDNLIQLGKKDD